jgi:hypothetical protein
MDKRLVKLLQSGKIGGVIYISLTRLLSELVSFAYFLSSEEFLNSVESISGKILDTLSGGYCEFISIIYQ